MNVPTLNPIPAHDPDAWRAPFLEWLHSACVTHPRFFTAVHSLHIVFCEWENARGGVPCNRETFIRLLDEQRFLMGKVEGILLVSGLAFREDLQAFGL